MDRRKALKNMGMSLGYVVATPTLISIVQSCKEENVAEWTPDFFSEGEGSAITHLVDIILPKTDTPSASDVNVQIFIDRFIDQVTPDEHQDILRMCMGEFMEKALADSGKETAAELTSSDLQPVLASALEVSKEQQASFDQSLEDYVERLSEDKTAELEAAVARNAFANNLRQMTIYGYKSSEYIGEEVLAYLSIPGSYVACGTTEELTGGKAWSL